MTFVLNVSKSGPKEKSPPESLGTLTGALRNGRWYNQRDQRIWFMALNDLLYAVENPKINAQGSEIPRITQLHLIWWALTFTRACRTSNAPYRKRFPLTGAKERKITRKGQANFPVLKCRRKLTFTFIMIRGIISQILLENKPGNAGDLPKACYSFLN